MMTPEAAAARDLARRLLERETAGATEGASFGAAMQRAWMRVSDTLRRSVGDDGYNALLARALARTEGAQPVLKDLRSNESVGIRLDVVTAVESHGSGTVREAVELLLAAVIDILSDLIGADMVRNLFDHDETPQAPRGRSAQ
jgi:hypothetical protein